MAWVRTAGFTSLGGHHPASRGARRTWGLSALLPFPSAPVTISGLLDVWAEWRITSGMKDCVEGMNTRAVLSLPRGSGFLGVSPAPFLVASQEIDPPLGVHFGSGWVCQVFHWKVAISPLGINKGLVGEAWDHVRIPLPLVLAPTDAFLITSTLLTCILQ